MNGVILSLLLSYFWVPGPTVIIGLGEIEGGYHVGPVYGVVCVGTQFDPITAVNNIPLTVFWDFKLGIRLDGVNVYISRACQHNVFGDLVSGGGLRIVGSWSNWP